MMRADAHQMEGMKTKRTDLLLLLLPVLALLTSCSHDYDSNTLDLVKYQWNMWPDQEMQSAFNELHAGVNDPGRLHSNPPSCDWDVLHRGNGKLVRIPAIAESHFSPEEQSSVIWFHVRHTLPELWAGREISLSFEGVSQQVEIYLNEELVGAYLGKNTSFTIDITDKVYYVRDNHLALRVYDPVPGSCGITGKILVVSKVPDQVTEHRSPPPEHQAPAPGHL